MTRSAVRGVVKRHPKATLLIALSSMASLIAVACSDSTSAPVAAAAKEGGSPDVTSSPAPNDAATTPDRESEPEDASADAGSACSSLPNHYGSKACDTCIATKCCGQVTACEGQAECKTLEKCLIDCLAEPDGGGCYDGCMAAHPDGKSLWDPVQACWFGEPPANCGPDCT